MVGTRLAVPPAVASSNRGLFLGLVIGVAYVSCDSCSRGRWLAVPLGVHPEPGVLFLL